MKFKYAASTILSLCAAANANAQAVTVYGSVDVGVVRATGGTKGANWAEDHYHTSRLGFRGSEDLGDGLSAIFKLETRFLAKNGTQQDAATFWNDESYIGLSNLSKYGMVRLGRVYSPFYLAVAGRIDPFNGDGIGSMTGWSSLGHNLSPGNPFDAAKGYPNRDVRTSNSFDYTSPTYGGFTLQLQTSLPDAAVSKQKAIVVKYDSDAFFAETGYEKKAYSNKAYTAHLGGGVVLGKAKITAGYATGYYDDDEAARDNKASSVLLGITYNGIPSIPELYLLGAVARLKMDQPTLLDASKGTGSDVTKVSVGADYYFSKRTKVYAHYSHVDKPISILFVSNLNKFMVGLDHKF